MTQLQAMQSLSLQSLGARGGSPVNQSLNQPNGRQQSVAPRSGQARPSGESVFSLKADQTQRSQLEVGLISGATTGGLVGLASVPLIPYPIVNGAAALGTGLVGGIAGVIAAQKAENVYEAVFYGAAIGAAITIGVGLLKTDPGIALGGGLVVGGISGAIGGLTGSLVRYDSPDSEKKPSN